MDSEIRISREELARDIVIMLRVCRQRQPRLLRDLAALKDERGFPDHDRETRSLAAFAEYMADKLMTSGKRIVRDRPMSLQGTALPTMEESGITPNGKARAIDPDLTA